MRSGEADTSASDATTVGRGTPHHRAADEAANALPTCCTPYSERCTSAVPQGVTNRKLGRSSLSSDTFSARTSASARTASPWTPSPSTA